MFRSVALLALGSVVAAFVGCADSESDRQNAAAESRDVAEIYKKVLDNWVEMDKNPLNVSIEAESPSPEEIEEFSKCVVADEKRAADWLPAKPISDLTSAIGGLSYVRLVRAEDWNAEDPGDLMAQGTPVESAVASGFSHGLFTMSAITFDEAHQTAALTYSFVCGMLCGSGATVIYRKTPNGWLEREKHCGGWIS